MRASAIIVAAGSGIRLGMDVPKAFVPLDGRALLHYSLRVLRAVDEIAEAVVTVPAGMEPTARTEAKAVGLEIPIKVTAGGAERQDSVRIALALTSAEAEVVVVHDAARPFALPALFASCIDTALKFGAAIAAVPVADTLKRAENHRIIGTVPRAGLWQAQTPQAFRRSILVAAHERAQRERWTTTDDADLAERCGGHVEVVEASAANLKITTRDDLEIAEALAQKLLNR